MPSILLPDKKFGLSLSLTCFDVYEPMIWPWLSLADASMFVSVQIGYWKTELSPNDWARSKFQDIPSTCYFALVTMTTVGYGDIYPLSSAGQTFAAIFCTAGVVSIHPICSIKKVSHLHIYMQSRVSSSPLHRGSQACI